MPGLFGGVTSPIFTNDFRLCPADARENTPLLPVSTTLRPSDPRSPRRSKGRCCCSSSTRPIRPGLGSAETPPNPGVARRVAAAVRRRRVRSVLGWAQQRHRRIPECTSRDCGHQFLKRRPEAVSRGGGRGGGSEYEGGGSVFPPIDDRGGRGVPEWSTGSPSSKGPSIGGLFGKLASDFRLCPADARENTPLLPVK